MAVYNSDELKVILEEYGDMCNGVGFSVLCVGFYGRCKRNTGFDGGKAIAFPTGIFRVVISKNL